MKRLLIAASMFVALRRQRPLAAQAAIEVHEASVADLRAALTSGRATSAQLVDAYLARITAYEHAGPAINALIRINPNARAEARARDAERAAGRARGALHGIPVIIKDNYDTGDMPTSGGSIALATSQPARDAFVVRKLREGRRHHPRQVQSARTRRRHHQHQLVWRTDAQSIRSRTLRRRIERWHRRRDRRELRRRGVGFGHVRLHSYSRAPSAVSLACAPRKA
jgi:hypothetical protein